MKALTVLKIIALSIYLPAISFANPKISDFAITPITQASYPTFYAKWGSAWVKKTNTLLPKAAEMVAASPECDKVSIIEVSTSKSIPKKNIVFFADCENGKRFYIEQSEVENTAPIKSESAKVEKITDMQALASCEQAIKSQLVNPLTFNRKILGTDIHRGRGLGIGVNFVFEAKNNFGASLPKKAYCLITERGAQEALILNE